MFLDARDAGSDRICYSGNMEIQVIKASVSKAVLEDIAKLVKS